MHSALGFFNMDRVQKSIVAERCFFMQPKWTVRIDDEHLIGGVNVTMLQIWLEVSPGREALFAWTLAGNISTK